MDCLPQHWREVGEFSQSPDGDVGELEGAVEEVEVTGATVLDTVIVSVTIGADAVMVSWVTPMQEQAEE
jgi:hypothetical protein